MNNLKKNDIKTRLSRMGWSYSAVSTPDKQAVHLTHPSKGTLSVVEMQPGEFHVKHNGAIVNIQGKKAIFDNPKVAIAHALNHLTKISSNRYLKRSDQYFNNLRKALKLNGTDLRKGGPFLTHKGKIVNPNPGIKTDTKSFLDQDNGVLHTPKGSFNLHFPDVKDTEYEKILNSPDIQDVHTRAMNNWFKLHNILKSGKKLPKEIVAHANLFSILSANTPVPQQELGYSRLMDTFKKLKIDPFSPGMGEAMGREGAGRKEWELSDRPDVLPEHSREYWAGRAKPAITQRAYGKLTGRLPGDIVAIGTMDAFADRIARSAPLHHYVANLVDKHGMDAQKIVSEMMRDKADPKLPEDHPMKLGAGLGSKTARYATAMMGGGNVTIPDTHFVRHLFGMDQNVDSDSIGYLKKVLWNPRNHRLLNDIDSIYAKKHPAVRYVTNKYFGGQSDPHAVFPAFWLHWLSIAPHEKAQDIGKPFAAKNLTDHTPFWDTVKEVLDKHGLGGLAKSEYEQPIYHRTAQAALELEHKLGPTAASIAYYAYLVPHLLHTVQEKNATNEQTAVAKNAAYKYFKSRLKRGFSLGVNKTTKEINNLTKKEDKPFHGYNKEKHSRTGGLNAKYREKYNREHGSNLKAPVTEKNPSGKRAARRKSFCARMKGVKGPTSKKGKLTPKGAALKRWQCSKNNNDINNLTKNDQPLKLMHYSDQKNLKTIDPKFMGKGVRGQEFKHGLPEVPRSYFYMHNTPVEDIVKQNAKSKYSVTLPNDHKIYDLATDPANHVAETVKMNNGAWNSDLILGKLKELGYHGFRNSGSALPNVVALFHPVAVEREHPAYE